VHAKGSFIFLQIWAAGRAVDPSFFEKQDPPLPYVSASDVKLSTMNISPRPLTIPEIRSYIDAYRTAAGNAVDKAGFDGVEIHGANGFLIEQFLKNHTNKRTDEYGGSISGRSKFALEVVDAVVEAVGERKTGIRLSPWNTYQGLLHFLLVIFDVLMMPLTNNAEMSAADSVPTYSYVITELRKRHPDLAFIHAIEPRVDGISEGPTVPSGASNDFIRELWHEKRLITAGGYTRESGIQTADEKGDLIAYGHPFIANVGVHVSFSIGVQVADPDCLLARSADPPAENHSTHYR
jgi:NADPH2 dehydrogenase